MLFFGVISAISFEEIQYLRVILFAEPCVFLSDLLNTLYYLRNYSFCLCSQSFL